MSDIEERTQSVATENGTPETENNTVLSVNEKAETQIDAEVEKESIQSSEQSEKPQTGDNGDVKNGGKKKFKLGTVGKCTLVLVVIALVAGVLLGVVNMATYVDPDAAISEKCAKMYEVSDVAKNDDRAINYDSKNVVKSCFEAKDEQGNVLGYCYYSVGSGAKDGEIELLVYIDVNGIIKDIEVYSQGETAGYFAKVEKANKPKYVGLNVNELDTLELIPSGRQPKKDGEISAVSQATYTSTGYHNAIAVAVYAFRAAAKGETK